LSGIRIRKAEPADTDKLAELGYRAWHDGILPLLPSAPGAKQAERHRLHQAVVELLDRIIVVDVNGQPMGWCARSKRRSYIPYLLISPEAQSQGLGAMLLKRMESIMELEGADRVELETPADNVRAVRFYEKQGYRILAMRADNAHAHLAFMRVHLEKRLNPYFGNIGDL
jgi:ribosomal-protein-alanine N-acetyltransferase